MQPVLPAPTLQQDLMMQSSLAVANGPRSWFDRLPDDTNRSKTNASRGPNRLYMINRDLEGGTVNNFSDIKLAV